MPGVHCSNISKGFKSDAVIDSTSPGCSLHDQPGNGEDEVISQN